MTPHQESEYLALRNFSHRQTDGQTNKVTERQTEIHKQTDSNDFRPTIRIMSKTKRPSEIVFES